MATARYGEDDKISQDMSPTRYLLLQSLTNQGNMAGRPNGSPVLYTSVG